jgi:cytochrome o ubiquinol oxidase subunit 1
MPSNTSAGVFIGVFSLMLGFGGIWHIWWLATVGLIGIVATAIVHSSIEDGGYFIPAETVRRIEEGRGHAALAQEVK